MYKGAIIGGTGFEDLGRTEGKREIILTPFGEAEVFLGEDLVFLSRHRHNHTIAPHLINYRANIWALKQFEVKNIICIYAVGSATEKLAPGTVGIVSDFIDFTRRMDNSFFDGKIMPLRHQDVSALVDSDLAGKFIEIAMSENLPFKEQRGVYVTTNGPRLDTAAEVRFLRNMGGDFIGMTMGSEAPLCIEAEMNYLPIAFSVNWASGIKNSQVVFLSEEKMRELSQKITLCAVKTLINHHI